MKTQIYRRAALGLTLAMLPFVAGCETDEVDATPGLMMVAAAEPATQTVVGAETNATPKVEGVPAAAGAAKAEPTEAAAAAEAPAVPAKPAGDLALPPNIQPSSPLAGVIKLAQSGVDEGVLLTYITNSGSTFGLGADEIVYLNDLGMPSAVITQMIEHDKGLKEFWANQAAAQTAAAAAAPAVEAAPAEQTAVAPSYENPPPAEAVPAEPQPANVTYNYFYDTLSPYGSWVSVDGYGMCWQPSVVVVNRGWRPYCDGGRWIYSDAGWYWYSDYTWGWAPFHYGRWFTHPRWGWCWYPGYTWGPSWVSWRYTDGYCGWAPLPPAAYYSAGFGFTYYGSSVGVSFGFGLGYDCYTFVPWNRFCNYRPSRYYAPRHHARDIYRNSTVVNNIINGDNNTIINNGVPLERVRSATKSEIRQVAIRDVNSVRGKNVRRERLEGDGRTLAVHRPQLAQTSTAPTRSGGSGERGIGTDLETRLPAASPSQRLSEPRATSARTVQRDGTPLSGRSSLAEESPTSRTTVSSPRARDSVSAQGSPVATTSRASSPKPIDVPSNRSATRPTPTRAWSSGNATAETVTPQATAPSPRPSSGSSLVVIGRKEGTPARQPEIRVTQPQNRSVGSARPESRSSTVNAAGESEGLSRSSVPQRSYSQPQPSAPSVNRGWSPSVSQPVQRQESTPPSRSVQPSYSAPRSVQPTYSAPRSVQPSYSAPVQRPSPSYSAPVQRPSAPSYTPPVSTPSPAPRPQPSAPAVSAPRSAPSPPPAARSESPSRSSEGRSRGRN